MTFRRTVVTLVLLLSLSLASSITYDQLKEQAQRFYGDVESQQKTKGGYETVTKPASEASLEQGDAVFAQFMKDCDDLTVLEDAAYLWGEYAPERYRDWIESVTSDADSPLKYFYLWFDDASDQLSRINAGRKLAQDYPDQVVGYRLMVKGYFENYPPEDYFEDYETVIEMLQQDLPFFNTYYQRFEGDDYRDVAGIIYHVYSEETESAVQILEIAYRNKAQWLEWVDAARVQPVEMWHELIYAYLMLLQEDEVTPLDPDSYDDVATELAAFYYEEAEQYDRVISILAGNEDALENYYLRFILANSYYQVQNTRALYDILVCKDEFDDSVVFLRAWLEFDEEGAKQVYPAALSEHQDIQARYLLARLNDQTDQTLQLTRQMIRENSRESIGYQLLSETYLDFFAFSNKDDPERAEWIEEFKRDKSHFSAYYVRYPEDIRAQVTVLFSRLMDGNTESARKFYTIIVEKYPFSEEAKLVDKVLLDEEMYELLWDAKGIFIDQMIKTGILIEDEKEEYKAIAYVSSLYSSMLFDELVYAVNEHPEWLEFDDIQYMAVNANYHLGNYPATIQILRLMLDKETIGYDMLVSLEETPAAEEEGWQELMEYAQSKAGAEVEDQKEPEVREERAEPVKPAEREEFPVPVEPEEPVEFEEAVPIEPDDFEDEDEELEEEEPGFDPYEAPEWVLPDAEGNLIKLSDYRGQIVILDFWATWCGPCQSAMPLIDDWMKTKMPSGVKVFSINVWEQDVEGAINYMTDNKFGMKLVFGKNETVADYGVEGIPYIVVIDQEGMVRFTEIGFSPDLKQKLTKWVNALK